MMNSMYHSHYSEEKKALKHKFLPENNPDYYNTFKTFHVLVDKNTFLTLKKKPSSLGNFRAF